MDGDAVTIATSQGTNADLLAVLTFSDPNQANPCQLQRVDLSLNAAAFAGTNLTINAKRGTTGGDGVVNVGYIDAFAANGGTALDLGAVKITGDLGAIDVGDGVTTTPACKSLTVLSLGRYGTSTGAPDLVSDFIGRLGALKVGGDIREATVHVTGGVDNVDGKIGSITVKGSLIGTTPADGNPSGGQFNPVVLSAGESDALADVRPRPEIGTITVGGRVEQTIIHAGSPANPPDGSLDADAQIGTVIVGGDWIASRLAAGTDPGPDGIFGSNDDTFLTGGDAVIVSKIARITIKGQALGTVGGTDSFRFMAEKIGALKIAGSLVPLTAGPDNLLVGPTGDLHVFDNG